MKWMFPTQLANSLRLGKTIEAELDEERFELRIDLTHGECVCKIKDGEETPLFSARYLDAKYKLK